MAAVLDAPMAPIHLKEAFRVCLRGRSAGKAIGGIAGVFPGLFVDRFPFDHERLTDVREVEIGVERGGGPNPSGLDASVFVIDGHSIGLLAPVEVEHKVLEQAGLVAFDGEVVMRVTVLDQVAGEIPLRQQGIGADVFALNLDRLQHGDGHLNLIGLLDTFGIAVDLQGADFFWV